jgi:hypothetical protein
LNPEDFARYARSSSDSNPCATVFDERLAPLAVLFVENARSGI